MRHGELGAVKSRGKHVHAFNLAPRHEDVWGSGGIASRIVYLGNTCDDASASRFGRFAPTQQFPSARWSTAVPWALARFAGCAGEAIFCLQEIEPRFLGR
jgi:hypothetical protein